MGQCAPVVIFAFFAEEQTHASVAGRNASRRLRAATANGSSERPCLPSSGVFRPIMRTLRPSLRRKVSPSTTRCTATGASPLGTGQKA
jgi:hypothetical protein